MNKKIILWLGVLALTAAPAVSVMAQGGPDEDGPEAGVMDEGGRPDMPEGPAIGMKGHQGQPGMEMNGSSQMVFKKKMMMRGGQGMGGPGFLSEAEVLAAIKKHDPVFSKKVEDLKTIAPAKYKMLVMMGGRQLAMAKMAQDESMEKDLVRGLALEFDTKELAAKYDKASDAEKKAIKETLRAKLGELFDLKTKGQEMRVKHMEGEIGKLKKNLEARKANKAKIVDQRLEQVTGEGYGW
jgi:hypothetical protein